MKAFIKANYRLLVLTFLSLAAGILIGLAVGLSAHKPMPQEGESFVEDATHMTRVMRFTACEHDLVKEMDTRAYLGYTRSDIQNQFPNASILRFDDEAVTLFESSERYCPRHYILKLRTDGRLGVMHTDGTVYTEELVTLIAEDAVPASAMEHARLEKGIAFDSLSEIDTYLESMGS